MELMGTRSWQISWGTGNVVRHALYVRDALTLSVAPEIPALIPPVAVAVPDEVDQVRVAGEWPGWWADVLSFVADDPGDQRERYASFPMRPESPALAGRPAIRAALAVLVPLAAQHFRRPTPEGTVRGRGRNIGELVEAREIVLGRKARPFRLVVTEMPVDGLVWHRVANHHVLVSARFAADDQRCDAALGDLIAELA
jgi:hypothetical protein